MFLKNLPAMLGKPYLFLQFWNEKILKKKTFKVASDRPLVLTKKHLYNISKLFCVDIQTLNFINRI